MAKYQWRSGILQKKAKKYIWYSLALSGLALFSFYALPESAKMVWLAPLATAWYFVVAGIRVQSADKKLKKQ